MSYGVMYLVPEVSGAAIPRTYSTRIYLYSRVHRYYYTEAQDNIGIHEYVSLLAEK